MNGGKQKQINQKKKLKSCGKPQTQLMNQYIALYCEMVGIGIGGKEHMVARVSIVNQVGDVLIDKFVKPQHPVVDYRTEFSGIRRQDLISGENFEIIRREVSALLHNRILIGHSVHGDLNALRLKHPRHLIRDISEYPPLTKMASLEGGKKSSLRLLGQRVLNKDVRNGERGSLEDSMTAMELYKSYQKLWERDIRKGN